MKRFALVQVGLATLALAGCTPDWAKENESTLLMAVTTIQGVPGGTATDSGSVLLSDVTPVFNDIAEVTVRLSRKNPDGVPSASEDVTLTRYEVRYFRTDGRNQEGVDVPFRITGPLSATITAPSGASTSTATVPIDVVRHQAKLEAPLLNLRNFTVHDAGSPTVSGAGVLTVIAEITVYGRSLNDKALSASGQLQITFANFAD